MLPRDFYGVYYANVQRIKEDYKRQQALFAQLQATIANFVPMRTKKSKKYKAKDFMPMERKILTDAEWDRALDKLDTMVK